MFYDQRIAHVCFMKNVAVPFTWNHCLFALKQLIFMRFFVSFSPNSPDVILWFSVSIHWYDWIDVSGKGRMPSWSSVLFGACCVLITININYLFGAFTIFPCLHMTIPPIVSELVWYERVASPKLTYFISMSNIRVDNSLVAVLSLFLWLICRHI